MALPGFTADASLYRSLKQYHVAALGGVLADGITIPQLLWPPGQVDCLPCVRGIQTCYIYPYFNPLRPIIVHRRC